MSSKKFLLTVIVFLAIFTRFFGLKWGDGHYFHPDENNMASSLSQLTLQDLNPRFFAYGQFPLYLGFFTLKSLGLDNDFANSVFILRFYSALFSLLSLYFFYKIYPNLKFVILLIFTPGLIQLAHFGTTESLLILTFAINLYLAKLMLKKLKLTYFLWASIVSAIALATKLSGIIFTGPILLALLLQNFSLIPPFFILTILLATLLSPYNLILWPDFLSSMKYETGVASGRLPVFYTQQFVGTWPYIFQLAKIFPYTNGLPVIIFSFFSLKNIKKIFSNQFNLIVTLSSLVYFLYFGQLYVKWTRFMSPLFFLLPLLSLPLLKKFPKLIFLGILPGILFFANYFLPDTRVQASDFILKNIPQNSTILSESGNVVNLPLSGNFQVTNYDFYNYNPTLLEPLINNAEYILVPSRRVFKNYDLPYHRDLFSGKLPFQRWRTFSPLPDFLLNGESAEETWTVFDRPTIRLYQHDSHH